MDKNTKDNTREIQHILFYENCCYSVEQVAEIIGRCPKTVRKLCASGLLPARCDRGGYIITGWALRAYLECRLPVCQ
ncbi:MAG: helix-turn-helix domain-containing protein [Lentisphaeria bacterium]|nr:helix-turn-helix domain-containing protein [Lentisphaeria bacterium]